MLGLPSGPSAMSPARDATSTCSSTGIGRYCLVSHSKNASFALLKAPIAVSWAPPTRSRAAILQHVHGLIAAVEDDGKRALAQSAMKHVTSHVSLQGPILLR